jgi:hypothetical protein
MIWLRSLMLRIYRAKAFQAAMTGNTRRLMLYRRYHLPLSSISLPIPDEMRTHYASEYGLTASISLFLSAKTTPGRSINLLHAAMSTGKSSTVGWLLDNLDWSMSDTKIDALIAHALYREDWPTLGVLFDRYSILLPVSHPLAYAAVRGLLEPELHDQLEQMCQVATKTRERTLGLAVASSCSATLQSTTPSAPPPRYSAARL